METWLVTGAGGFLGRRILEYWSEDKTKKIVGMTRQEMDFTDPASVKEVFRTCRPDVLVHTGAISDTGVCERDPALSERVNVYGTRVLAEACAEWGTKLVCCSSDQVYYGADGRKPHTEEEELLPANVYGRHKLNAEKLCSEICPDSVSLRLSWMFDIPTKTRPAKPNFVTHIMEAVQKQEKIRAAVHDFRGITYVKTVVENLAACKEFPGGAYNWGSENPLNTYEMTRDTVKLLGGDPALVIADTERNQEDPRNLCMDMEKVRTQGIDFPDTIYGIEAAFREYGVI